MACSAPTCLQMTVAAALLKRSSQTVPHTPLRLISSLPAVVLAGLRFTSRTEAAHSLKKHLMDSTC